MTKYYSLAFHVKVLFEAHVKALFFSQRRLLVYNQPEQACSSFLCKLVENELYYFFKWTSSRPLLPPPRDEYLSVSIWIFFCWFYGDIYRIYWLSQLIPNLRLNFLLKVLEIIYVVTFTCPVIGWKRTNHGPLSAYLPSHYTFAPSSN